jgi:6-pyruvoyltetrahydropterin/6-carboxytetrahydropterin synthase
MFHLTREVRFSINDPAEEQLHHPPTNSYGGYPSLNSLGRFFEVQVTLSGDLDPASQYVINIKQIDDAVRTELPEVQRMLRDARAAITPARLTTFFHDRLRFRWADQLQRVTLKLSPFQEMSIHRSEFPMIRLSQKFEFSASHRLHNPKFSDEENRSCFGKCNNPHGHGHNYELQVTLRGEPNEKGLLADVPEMERIVGRAVIARFDHKNLNSEVAEFMSGDLIPTVENIARVIYRSLKPEFARSSATLAAVTVWETPKTWCEYQE